MSALIYPSLVQVYCHGYGFFITSPGKCSAEIRGRKQRIGAGGDGGNARVFEAYITNARKPSYCSLPSKFYIVYFYFLHSVCIAASFLNVAI